MGGRDEDYRAVAPDNSYIHVDNFDGPQQLAEHLKLLDNNPLQYNRHFQVRAENIFIIHE